MPVGVVPVAAHPAFHLDDRQPCIESWLPLLEHLREFGRSSCRDAPGSSNNSRTIRGLYVGDGPLQIGATNRVGPVEHDDFLAGFCRRFKKIA